MERKIYNKPFMVREQFDPQEYCAACEITVTALPSETVTSALRLDGFPANGKFDAGERAGDNHLMLFAKPVYKLNPKYYEIVNMNVYQAFGHATEGTEAWEVGKEYKDGVTQWDGSTPYRYEFVTNQLIHYHYGSTDFYLMMDGKLGTQLEINKS